MFGNERHLIKSQGDHVFLVDLSEPKENGDPRTMMLSLKAMREFISEVDKDDD